MASIWSVLNHQKGVRIRSDASRAERLLGAAEDIKSNVGRAKFGEQVGKGMQDHSGDFELGRKFDNLGTGTAGDAFWSAFITLLDATQHQQCFIHSRYRVSVLLINRRTALRRDGATKALTWSIRKRIPGSLECPLPSGEGA